MPQITFEPDIIETTGGRFFKLSSMRFFEKCPYTPEMLGKLSPRIFKPFDENVGVNGGYFDDFVQNSFPEKHQKIKFLIKFYHCLLAGQLQLKTPKLCLVGDSDSGKSSLASVLFGLTQRERLATISKEKTFGMSMVNDHTQLVFIDEMSANLLAADLAKVFLQGGIMTVTQKHENARIIDNDAGKFPFNIVFFSLHLFRFNGNSETLNRLNCFIF